ncbi:MAG TPA: hypothetical protein VHL05_12445 [Terriglobales bacterium]|jgi:hypothetical protein|nr:hypothetical protein [Terriglobales bacterium]
MSAFKVQRGSPLPPGRYWQDFFGDKVKVADDWFTTQAGMGNGKVLEREQHPQDDGVWILWEVPAGGHMPWPEVDLGAPTIATPDIQHQTDTTGGPEPATPTLEEAFSSTISKVGLYIGGALLAGLVVHAIISRPSKG